MKLESPDIAETVVHFNSKPSSENNQFELLNSSSNNDESSGTELIDDDENKIVKSSESELELITESDID
ncbi:2861_t:CDS:1, partial [Cetraspora pellucida]